MTSDDTTFPYEVGGRTIGCKRLTEGQLVMARRMLSRWQQQVDGAGVTDEQRTELLMQMEQRTLDMIESQILDPDDVTWLEEQLLLGAIDFGDLRPIMSGGKRPEPVADDEPPKKAVKRQPVRGIRAAARKK